MKMIIAALLASNAIHAAPVSDFDRAIASAQAADAKSDQFAVADTSLVGKPFSFRHPLGAAWGNFNTIGYHYDGDSLTLSVVAGGITYGSTLDPKMLNAISISGTDKNTGSAVVENAFGAVYRATGHEQTVKSLAIVSSPDMMMDPMSTDDGLTRIPHNSWWFRQTLDPVAAKAMALDTDVVIEGHLAVLPNGRMGGCNLGAAGSMTTTLVRQTCYVGGAIERVAFVRRSTGEVIKQWTADAQVASGR